MLGTSALARCTPSSSSFAGDRRVPYVHAPIPLFLHSASALALRASRIAECRMPIAEGAPRQNLILPVTERHDGEPTGTLTQLPVCRAFLAIVRPRASGNELAIERGSEADRGLSSLPPDCEAT